MTKESIVVAFWICGLIGLSGAYPLFRMIRANRTTSLKQTVIWAAGAWCLWGVSCTSLHWSTEGQALVGTYLGLCLTGCAAIAVMGARRPGAQAWNAVVTGLLAVLALPLLEGQGSLRYLSLAQLIFLGAILTLGFVNYVPTRAGLASVLIGAGVVLSFIGLVHPPWRAWLQPWILPVTWALISTGLWVGHLRRHVLSPEAPDSLWLDFRERYGAVWALRMKEQFNQSVRHAGLPVELHWHGLVWTSEPDEASVAQVIRILSGLLKRFRAGD